MIEDTHEVAAWGANRSAGPAEGRGFIPAIETLARSAAPLRSFTRSMFGTSLVSALTGILESQISVYSYQMVRPIALTPGMKVMGVFLLFGALMASLAGATFVWRGTALDRMWTLNPRAYRQLAPFGKAVGIPFLLLGVTLCAAGIGWFKHRLWGWRLAVAVIATQVLGDAVNMFLGHVVEGGIGVAIAGVLLLYLLNGDVKAAFGSSERG